MTSRIETPTLIAVVKVTYEMRCPKCGTGYGPEQDPIGCEYQCEVCEAIFLPVDEYDKRAEPTESSK